MEDTINWWLLVFLGLTVIRQTTILVANRGKDFTEFAGVLIGLGLSWFLMYMAGIFTLL